MSFIRHFCLISCLISSFFALSLHAAGLARSWFSQEDKPSKIEPQQEMPVAQRPIERLPGLSEPSLEFTVTADGRYAVTKIDRDNETVKEWLKEGTITESQIREIEAIPPGSQKSVLIDMH